MAQVAGPVLRALAGPPGTKRDTSTYVVKTKVSQHAFNLPLRAVQRTKVVTGTAAGVYYPVKGEDAHSRGRTHWKLTGAAGREA
jgi:hypothetical protein